MNRTIRIEVGFVYILKLLSFALCQLLSMKDRTLKIVIK